MLFALDGALLGATHVLSGPDHLVGVAPLAAERRARIHPALVGASWGLGHGLGVAILGLLGQGVLSIASVEIASGWAERLVGLVLVALGVQAVWRAGSLTIHEHRHTHDGVEHVHLHVHEHDGEGQGLAAGHGHGGHRHEAHRHHHALAVGIGTIHGLAGAGHLFAVTLPSLALQPMDALLYVLGFLVASVIVMAGFGVAIGSLARAGGTRFLPMFVRLVGLVTIGIGIWWSIASWSAH
jgi:hypothetical protein